jgi:peptidoglycan/LPS O-acetylase OafA/YrhL
LSEAAVPSGRRRFHTLDGMRGIAALMIVFMHTNEISGALYRPFAYLGVDLFFVLSGVVLAQAYGRRLQAGLGLGAFLRLRWARLYPLYALATLLAVVPVLMVLKGIGENVYHWTGSQAALSLGLGLLMLPDLGRVALYPFLPPAWSLFYEMTANLLWAGVAGDRLRVRWMALVMFLGAGGMILALSQHGDLNLGRDATWLDLGTALCRVAYSFTAGLWIHRLSKQVKIKIPAVALLLFTLLLLTLRPSVALAPFYELGTVLILFPLLVLLGTASEPVTAFGQRCNDALGRASYGLYTLHIPVFLLLRGAARRLLSADLAASAPWGGLIFAAGMLVLVLGLDRYYDAPLRQRLNARS